jgi:thiol-disulfide isomerase/thioredoxin
MGVGVVVLQPRPGQKTGAGIMVLLPAPPVSDTMMFEEAIMVCPFCHLFTPDQNYKCINCGAVVQKKESATGVSQMNQPQREQQFSFKPWMLLILVLLGVLAYFFFAHQNKIRAVNSFNPGMEFDIQAYLKKGKTNIIDFYSEYCPPCRKISPLIVKLGRQRPDLAVLQVDINRKGIKGIDFFSPLARQYNLQFVPYFQIYDPEGNLLKQGQEATMEVVLMLAQAGINM